MKGGFIFDKKNLFLFGALLQKNNNYIIYFILFMVYDDIDMNNDSEDEYYELFDDESEIDKGLDMDMSNVYDDE